MSDKPSCGNCRFWFAEGPEYKRGSCRRHCPVGTSTWWREMNDSDGTLGVAWPIVSLEMWCGDHEPKEPK